MSTPTPPTHCSRVSEQYLSVVSVHYCSIHHNYFGGGQNSTSIIVLGFVLIPFDAFTLQFLLNIMTFREKWLQAYAHSH